MIDQTELQAIYQRRFDGAVQYRDRVWSVLCRYFERRFIRPEAAVLDLGCGYGEFINNIQCAGKWAMDANPDTKRYLKHDVTYLPQDCSTRWQLPDDSLDVVFTSNFFEHLTTKQSLRQTWLEVRRCLRPGGLLIAMGPNINCLHGHYWDFWDHHLPLSEASLIEGLTACGFVQKLVARKFLPYRMSRGPRFPTILVTTYLRLPFLWGLMGRQFLVVVEKP